MCIVSEWFFQRCYPAGERLTKTVLQENTFWWNGRGHILQAKEGSSASWIPDWKVSTHQEEPRQLPPLRSNAQPPTRGSDQTWMKWSWHQNNFRIVKQVQLMSTLQMIIIKLTEEVQKQLGITILPIRRPSNKWECLIMYFHCSWLEMQD